MRPIEDIVITLDAILAMNLDGLPKSERALRQFVKNKSWPVVFAENGKYLVLIDAIPEPFGAEIRGRLSPIYRLREGSFLPDLDDRLPAGRYPGWEVTEARLAILFEVFRRAAAVGEKEATRGFVADACAGTLPATLARAVQRAVIRGHKGKRRNFAFSIADALAAAHSGDFRENGTADAPICSFVSAGTIANWITCFRERGVKGLIPVTVS